MILEGLLTINGIDPYVEYGAFLSEEKQDGTENYSALMQPSAVKEQKEVSFREHDGVKLPDRIVQSREARDVTLRFTIGAADRAQFLTRYAGFVEFLQRGEDGWLDFYLPELERHFRFFYKDCPGYDQLTDFEGEVYASFTVKFREPNPAF